MANMYGLKKSGISEKTPKSLLLGAGTVYKSLTWSTDHWEGTLLGATSGGNSFKVTSEIVNVEVDGALVAVKGLTMKQGETAELTINMVEITPDILKMAMIGKEGTSNADAFTKIETKSNFEMTDYIDNLAFVGFLADDTPVIIIMENALCTSGLELSGKNKEATVIPCTFKSHADIVEGAVQDRLPVYIYYPKQKQG